LPCGVSLEALHVVAGFVTECDVANHAVDDGVDGVQGVGEERGAQELDLTAAVSNADGVFAKSDRQRRQCPFYRADIE